MSAQMLCLDCTFKKTNQQVTESQGSYQVDAIEETHIATQVVILQNQDNVELSHFIQQNGILLFIQ